MATESKIAAKKILIVDDNSISRRLIRQQLETENYEIYEASNGDEAVTAAETIDKIDLIILDIMMPEKDGYQTCKELKSNYKTKDTPVVMCTAKSSAEYYYRAKNFGAVDYIVKPCEKNELISTVKKYLKDSKE